MRVFWHRLRARIRHRRFASDLAEEMAVHRAMKAEELGGAAGAFGNARERGLEVDRAMGNDLLMRERAREVWIPPRVDALGQDVRDAFRLLVRRPAFSVAAIAALVLGVGAATLAYALANALLFKPLPVERPEQLVYLGPPSYSLPILSAVRARSPFLADAFGWTLEQYDTLWGDESDRSLVLLASGHMHKVLGVRPALGRLLDDSDDRPGAPAVAVLSYAAWQQRYGGQPTVLGTTVRIHGLAATIVGVTPRTFFGVAPGRLPEITVPVTLAPQLAPDADILNQVGRAWLHIMGRLAGGMTLDTANAQFQVVWKQVLDANVDPRETPERRARYLSRPASLFDGRLGFSSVRNQYREPLLILAGLTLLLWLVGCVTVANMFIAGAWGRSRELAVRVALGCGRFRLARQIFIEGLLVATIAAGVAVLLSRWSAEGLIALLATSREPVMLDLALDWRFAGFMTALIVASAALFSAAPMLLAVRLQTGPALKAGSRAVATQGRGLGRALVSVQTAFSVILLIGAALLLRSFSHLLSIDPGVESRRLLVAEIDPSAGAREPYRDAVPLDVSLEHALDRLAQMPGLVSASLAMYPPISHRDGSWTQTIGIDGAPPTETGSTTFFNAVGPRFFATTATRLAAGREFTDADTVGAERVAIINESLAARVFAGQDPIGHRITIGLHADRQSLTIVGIAADATYQRLQDAPRAVAYLPLAQTTDALTGRPVFALVRVADRPEDAAAAVRSALISSDARFAVRVEPLANRIRESLVTERILAVLAGGLASSALLLACAGLFGLLMHLVARRTRDIGVRMALGARRVDVVRPVIAQALLLTIIGLAIGGSVAWVSAGIMRGVLHGIAPNDPLAYGSVAVVTLVVSAAAGLVPARRAASVSPIDALRAE
jgi:predicted permease